MLSLFRFLNEMEKKIFFLINVNIMIENILIIKNGFIY